MNIQASRSEDAGIAALTQKDKEIYSVGISTGGIAEMRMAKALPGRHIIATTIDKTGLEFAERTITAQGLDKQIETKYENAAMPLSYTDARFDFIYARLVLHYLSKDVLAQSLSELWRVLKVGGKLFIVVRSIDCPDAKRPNNTIDPVTKLTTYMLIDDKTGRPYSLMRYFHTKTSITSAVENAGFTVESIKQYDEQLFKDFARTELAPAKDNVIELLARKEEEQ